jgi:hypothetical protein
MSTATVAERASARHVPSGANGAGSIPDRLKDDAGYQAFWLLRIGFTLLPIAFGLDKFFDVLVNWEIYLAP